MIKCTRNQAGAIAQVMKSLPHKTEDLGLIPRIYAKSPGLIVFACSLIAGEAGKEDSWGSQVKKHIGPSTHMNRSTCIHTHAYMCTHTVSGTLKVNVSVKELDKA